LAIAYGDARYARLLRSLAHVKLLILDDWRPVALTSNQARDMLEIVKDRYDNGSLIITSQVPIDRWHDLIGVPTLADAILDRFVHNAYRWPASSESARKDNATRLGGMCGGLSACPRARPAEIMPARKL
jgi:DNA replication protein DnaC